MQTIQIQGQRAGFATTQRVDRWWIEPAATAIGLLFFFGYLTFRAFNATYVWYDPYISPTVAPPLFTPASGYPGAVPVDHAWLGAFPGVVAGVPAAVAGVLHPVARHRVPLHLLLLPRRLLQGVRLDAAVLRACAASPRRYRGETALLLFQNLHRYTLYGALFLLACLWWEGLAAFFRDGRFGVGVGTVVMLINAALLTGYTFGCHSWRHLIGGRLDCFTCDGCGLAALSAVEADRPG